MKELRRLVKNDLHREYKIKEATRCYKAFFSGEITFHQYETVMAFLGMMYDSELGEVREIDF